MTAGNPKGWGEIRVEVLRRIRERIWPPGELIPSEEALAVEFCCARATVNRALRELAEAGVLERRRKAEAAECAGRQQASRTAHDGAPVQV